MSDTETTVSAVSTLTTAKAILAVARTARTGLFLRGEASPSRESWSDEFTFTLHAIDQKRDKDYKETSRTENKIEIPDCRVRNGNTSRRELRPHGEYHYTETFRPLRGTWSLYAHEERLIDILELVPSDAMITFEVYLDGITNGYLKSATSHLDQAGLHGDAIFVIATYTKRGKTKKARFLLDTAIGEHNSARFGYSND